MARRITTSRRAQRPRDPVISTRGDRSGDGARARSAKLPPRFPITKQGYDQAAVDQRFAELEQEIVELDRELADVDASTPPNVATEPAEIGQQVSAILIAAHQSAEETRRLAEAEANRRIADAQSRARSISDAPHRELMRLQDEVAALTRERERLLSDINGVADRLRALADKPSGDLPTEPLHDLRAAKFDRHA